MSKNIKKIEEIEQSTIEATQSLILDILKEYQKICEEHNLKFYLTAGSLLGAVRHKGFIPWDDDIDVGMPRKDYEIFIKNAHKWLKAPLELDCPEYNDKYVYFFAKVVNYNTTIEQRYCVSGAYIDIFPLDGVPDSKLRRRLHQLRFKAAKELFYICRRNPFRHGKSFGGYINLLIQKIISPKLAYKIYKSVITSYDFEKSNSFSDHSNEITNMMSKDVLGKEKIKIQFEDFESYGMKDNDTYLTCYFGDYMTPPPVEKRRPHHCAYRNLELPYREYLKLKKTSNICKL
ncbi:lipopolysaccharide cholinephosphotransferase [Dysgonomonadaceae bacterium PH5-43]|nr:lipopolysaccharide cholinephosphotransferase [Dysgonomonadaceae bacterium PH5-43]